MDDDVPTVPPPEPPDSRDAWYASGIHDQYEIVPGVVATVGDGDDTFVYSVRTPSLPTTAEADLRAVRRRLSGAELRRPRTREGAAEQFRDGFERKHDQVIDRVADCRPETRRRLDYHALSELKIFDQLTPHALDEAVEVGDHTGTELLVHLTDYAPAKTGIEAPEFLDRFSAERIERYTVEFAGYDIPVVRYRERLLGADPFERKYAVLEPDRLPEDDRLIAECKARIWDVGTGGFEGTAPFENRRAVVSERGKKLLSRRLLVQDAGAWIDAARNRLRSLLAERGLVAPPIDRRFDEDRLDDLLYYVLRDLVGFGQLTIPIRDPNLEDIEANRVGERIKVVPNGADREPTNLAFETEETFVNVVMQLAASDGVELSSSDPSAKVNLDPPGIEQTIRCAVALPTISEDGPHVSIRKQAADVLTPVDLVTSGSIPTELVTLLWLLYEHQGVVLFAGATGAGKTTLLNAHLPFIPYDDRPVSIDEGSKEVVVPHETGVSLSTREHHDDFKDVSMADLMTETNYLNPDTEIIAELNTGESFETFSGGLKTGHGVLGTTHADGIETLVNRLIEQGLPPYLLFEIDLVVFPRHVEGKRYVGSAVELLSEREAEATDRATETIATDEGTIHYNRILERTPDGEWAFAYSHPKLGDPTTQRDLRTFDRLADATNRPVESLEAEFHRKHGYVEYLIREGISDIETLFGLVSDLRTNEAATIERIQRQRSENADD